ncbi:MAG: MgtC/SapB family protein [Streptosporangiaceae bacterium]
MGAALFMLISKYGFGNVLHPGLVVVEPSRVAAQIVVTGVGFLGAGLIFVRRDSVLGLTTAASVWVTAAVGAAAGAGLVVLAITATGAYLVVTLAFPQVIRRLSRKRPGMSLRVSYPDGRGILRQVLQAVTDLGFTVDHLATKRNRPTALAPGPAGDRARATGHGRPGHGPGRAAGQRQGTRSVTWRPGCPRCPG